MACSSSAISSRTTPTPAGASATPRPARRSGPRWRGHPPDAGRHGPRAARGRPRGRGAGDRVLPRARDAGDRPRPGPRGARVSAPGRPPMSEYRRREQSITLSQLDDGQEGGEHETSEELLTLNFGPHHPATHGVLRLLVTLQSEIVRDVKPVIGYVHTGIEKTAEDKSYWKVIPVIERMDYLAYFFNALAFCGAVEALLEVEVPKRAQYLRVIHCELNRIASHLFWLGTSALDLGAISMFWYSLRERERIVDLFEMSSGQRMHTRYFQVGGVIEDIPPGFAAKVREFTRVMPARIDQYEALLRGNEIVLQRLRGTC